MKFFSNTSNPSKKSSKPFLKWVGVFVLFLIAFLIGLLVLIKYNFNTIATYIVDTETNHRYQLQIAHNSVDLTRNAIVLSNIEIKSKQDTVGLKAIKIKNIELEIGSLMDIITKRKFIINHLNIGETSFEINLASEKKQVELKDVFKKVDKTIQKTLMALSLSNLDIKDFKIIIHSGYNTISVKDVDLKVRNFRKETDVKKSFELDLWVGKQSIQLPLNKNISFDDIHWSNKNGLNASEIVFVDCPFSNNIAIKDTISINEIALKLSDETYNFNNPNIVIDTLLIQTPYVVKHKKVGNKHEKKSVSKQLNSYFEVFDNLKLFHAKVDSLKIKIIDNTKGQKKFKINESSLVIDSLIVNKLAGVNVSKIKLINNRVTINIDKNDIDLQFNEFAVHKNNLFLISPNISYAKKNINNKISIDRIELLGFNIDSLLNNKFIADSINILNPIAYINVIEKEAKKAVINKDLSQALFIKLHEIGAFFKSKKISIIDGNLNYIQQQTHQIVKLQGINVNLKVNKMIKSEDFNSIKKSIGLINVKRGDLKFPNLDLTLFNLKIKGENQINFVDSARLVNKKMTIRCEKVFWEKLNWDKLIQNQDFEVETITIGKIKSIINSAKSDSLSIKVNNQKNAHLKFNIGYLAIDEGDLSVLKNKEKIAAFKFDHISLSDLYNENQKYFYSNAELHINHIQPFEFKNKTVKLNEISIHSNEIKIEKLDIREKSNHDDFTLTLPSVTLVNHDQFIDFKHLNFEKCDLSNAFIKVHQHHTDTIAKKSSSKKSFPTIDIPEISLDFLSLNRLFLDVDFYNNKFHVLSKGQLDFVLNNFKVPTSVIKSQEDLSNLMSSIGGNFIIKLRMDSVALKLEKGDLNVSKVVLKANNSIKLSELNSILRDPYFVLSKISLESKGYHFSNKEMISKVKSIKWNPIKEQLNIDSLSFELLKSKEEFLSEHPYQSLFAKLNNASISVKGFNFKKFVSDSTYELSYVGINELDLSLAKDKTKPFKHGEDKQMFTYYLNHLKYGIKVDSVFINDGQIHYTETSAKTNKDVQLEFSKVNAKLLNINSTKRMLNDSLKLLSSLVFNDIPITRFNYIESYQDSLSGFKLRLKTKPFELGEFNSLTMPLINLGILNGKADTVNVKMAGNKYACIGEMKFFYRKLKINKQSGFGENDKKLINDIINFAANDIVLHVNNNKHSRIFFIRDQEKLVINLWIKSLLSGVFTSSGLKSNKKLFRQYKRKSAKFYLPKSVD